MAGNIIKDPGKFEGEMDWVPGYWEGCLEGGYDDDLEGYYAIYLNADDIEAHPGIGKVGDVLTLREDDNGFVHAETLTKAEWDSFVCQVYADEDAE